MTRSIGDCFAFYLKHFADMEAIYRQGLVPPKGVSVADWNKARSVSLKAQSQATSLLRRVLARLKGIVGAGRVTTYDQRSTLHEHWNIRADLHDANDYMGWLRVGFAIDAPSDGAGALFFWVQPLDRIKSKQPQVIDVLRVAGLPARPAPESGWAIGVVIVAEKQMSETTTIDECESWADDQVTRALLGPWESLRQVGKS